MRLFAALVLLALLTAAPSAAGSAAAPAGATAAALAAGGPAAPPVMPFAGPAVDVERLAITYQPGVVRVLDDVRLANPHDAPLASVSLPLAPGARRVQLVAGGAGAHPAGDALVVPVELAGHGHAELVFTYDVPAGGLPVELRRAVTMPTAAFAVLVRDGALAVRSGQLADVGVGPAPGGVRVRQYVAEGLPPGQTLRFTVTAPPTWFARLLALFTPRLWMAVGSALLAGLLALGLRREVLGT